MNRLIGLSLALLLVQTQYASAVSFQGLDDLLGEPFHNAAYAVSGDGSTVVGQGTGGAGAVQFEAARWTADGQVAGLGFLPVFSGIPTSFAWGVSADGAVVVGESSSGGELGAELRQQAFCWTPDESMVGLGYLPGGGMRSNAYGVSGDGMTVVGSSDSDAGLQAFRWTPAEGGEPGGEMIGLGHLPDDSASVARAVSADGSAVAGWSGATTPLGTSQAFLWTADDAMIGLGDLPGGESQSAAQAISADGSTVVGWSYSGPESEAFRWTEAEGMVGLGSLPGGNGYSEASAVSADGSIVIGRSNSASGDEAFIWDADNGMRSLRDLLVPEVGPALDGWALTYATGISADGTVIVGYDGALSHRAWMAVLDPPQGDTLTSIAGGNWNDATTWDGGTQTPTVEHATVVGNDHTVVVAENGSASSLNIDGASAAVAIDPGRTLTVVNDVQLTAGQLDIVSPGKLDVGGSFATEQGTSLSVAVGRSTEPVIVAADGVTLDVGTVLAVTAVENLGDLGAQEWGEKTRTIITAAGGATGEFDPLPPNVFLGHGVFYGNTTYDANAIHLNLFQAGPGDINGDRKVDFTDVWALLTGGYYNVSDPDPPADWTDGDTNGDGLVDFSDVWDTLTGGLYNTGPYGGKAYDGIDAFAAPPLSDTMPGVGQAATVVPEPGTLGLLAGGLLVLLLCRGTRRRRSVGG